MSFLTTIKQDHLNCKYLVALTAFVRNEKHVITNAWLAYTLFRLESP